MRNVVYFAFRFLEDLELGCAYVNCVYYAIVVSVRRSCSCLGTIC